jgi:hypothetical protein
LPHCHAATIRAARHGTATQDDPTTRRVAAARRWNRHYSRLPDKSTPSTTAAASCHPPRVADRCCHDRLTPARRVPSNSAAVDLAAEPGPAS